MPSETGVFFCKNELLLKMTEVAIFMTSVSFPLETGQGTEIEKIVHFFLNKRRSLLLSRREGVNP
jgi:hypothetical protein